MMRFNIALAGLAALVLAMPPGSALLGAGLLGLGLLRRAAAARREEIVALRED